VFSSVVDAPRSRRATDVIMLVGSVLLLVVLWWPAPGPTRVDTQITTLLRDLPGAWTLVWGLSFAGLVLWPLLLVLLVCVSDGRRKLLGDWLPAAVAAAALAFVIGDLAVTPWSDSFTSLASSGPPQIYLAVRVALASAVVATASPHYRLARHPDRGRHLRGHGTGKNRTHHIKTLLDNRQLNQHHPGLPCLGDARGTSSNRMAEHGRCQASTHTRLSRITRDRTLPCLQPCEEFLYCVKAAGLHCRAGKRPPARPTLRRPRRSPDHRLRASYPQQSPLAERRPTR
jgi:hypothetical protein